MTHYAATLPDQINAGLDFLAIVRLREYPATVWTLNALLRGPQAINLTATPDGDAFAFTSPAATTTTWLPGKYWFSLRASQGTAIMEAGSGETCVLPDIANVTEPYDGRSPNEIALDAIDAVMGKRATQDQQRYKINERELWRTPIADLLKLRAYYAVMVSRERAKARGHSRWGRAVTVKFSDQ